MCIKCHSAHRFPRAWTLNIAQILFLTASHESLKVRLSLCFRCIMCGREPIVERSARRSHDFYEDNMDDDITHTHTPWQTLSRMIWATLNSHYNWMDHGPARSTKTLSEKVVTARKHQQIYNVDPFSVLILKHLLNNNKHSWHGGECHWFWTHSVIKKNKTNWK